MQLGDNDIVIYVSGNITDFQNKMAQAKVLPLLQVHQWLLHSIVQ